MAPESRQDEHERAIGPRPQPAATQRATAALHRPAAGEAMGTGDTELGTAAAPISAPPTDNIQDPDPSSSPLQQHVEGGEPG